MKIKTFLVCWVAAFIVMFPLNGLFHGLIAANFFDERLSHLGMAVHKMSEINPLWVGLLELVLTFGMTYFITLSPTNRIPLGQAGFAGGLINLIAAGTWNFANAAIFVIWSNTLTLVDLIWHIAIGSGGGLLIAIIANKLNQAK